MEFPKSQLGLRSMDMEGRSLGTERPSVSTSRNEGGAASSARFTSILRARTSEGAPGTQELRSSTIDDVSARIRDGRTDAAEVEPDVRDSVRERDPSEDAADPDAEDRGNERREPREERGREREREPRRRPERGSDDGPSGREGEDLSSAERSIHLTDASDARGHSGEDRGDGAGDGSDVIGHVQFAAPIVQQPIAGGPAGAAQAAPVAIAAFAAGPAAGARGGPASPQVAPIAPTGRASQAAAAARPEAAAGTRPGASQMERAEAILEQLKVQIKAGEKEARLQLRPQELGLLDMRIKVDGGVVTAALAAESAETLAVLEAHAPELRAWLSRDGAERVELSFERLDLGAGAGQDQSATKDTKGEGRRERGSRGSAAPLLSSAAGGALAQTLARTSTQDTGVDLVA